MKRTRFYIGIDCGVNTGFAQWDASKRKLVDVRSLMLHEAIIIVRNMVTEGADVTLVIEDARKVKFKVDPHKAQGAGSVKRDAKIWEDFCKDYKIPYLLKRPNNALTKLPADRFISMTGWQGQTNSHGRDAALLVYGI